jgi:hypothetical protein
MIQRAVRVNNRYGAMAANPQTIGLGSQNAAATVEPEFFKPSLQKFPRFQTCLSGTASRLCCIRTNKNMAFGAG